MKGGRWIWKKGERKADEYVTFLDGFSYDTGNVKAEISVYGDYALYVNDVLVSFGQYPDYEKYKVYDQVDITPFLKHGENELKIIAWYIGEDNFSYQDNGRGLRYVVYSPKKIFAQSCYGVKCALSEEYVSYCKKNITAQLGFSYTYNTNRSILTTEEAIEIGGAAELVLRQNKKVYCGDFVEGTLVDEGQRLYDLGKECCGFLRIRFIAEKDKEIQVLFGEHILDGYVRSKIKDRDFSVGVIGNGRETEAFCVLRRLGCRYLQVVAEEGVEILSIGIVETLYPFQKRNVKIDNPLRRRIYDVSVRTLELCAHEHYEDCPWREQAMYIEDSRNQMLCGYYAFNNCEFSRAAILSILQGQREDGLFDICFPARCAFTIPSFSLVFPTMVMEYTQAVRETEIATKALRPIERMLMFFLERITEKGLFKTVSADTLWHFYEWADDLDGDFFSEDEEKRKRNGYDVLVNAFLSLALKATADLCNVLGDFEKAQKYMSLQAGVNAAINSCFWNATVGMYKTYENAEKYSSLANSLCVLCGATNNKQTLLIAEKLATNCDAWVRNTLSMNVFRFDAMLKADFERFAPVVLAEIDTIYSKMLSFDATSFWETAQGAEDFDGAGSLCHGWSAIPVYYYHVLGVVEK